MWLRIPRDRIRMVLKGIKRARLEGRLTARAMDSTAGQCVPMAKGFLPAIKHPLRNVYRVLRSRYSWHDVLLLDQSTLQDLHWWTAALKSWNGQAVLPYQTPFQMTTDASALAWGATLQGQNAQG